MGRSVVAVAVLVEMTVHYVIVVVVVVVVDVDDVADALQAIQNYVRSLQWAEFADMKTHLG